MRYERDGDVGVLYVDGEVDHFAVGALVDAIDAKLVLGELAVDLSGVEFIDSAGVDELLNLAVAGRVALRAPSRAVTRVLALLDEPLVANRT